MTIEMCKRLCLTKNHLFAGAQSRAQCYCGDVEPSPGFKSSPQGLCSWPCLGDSNQVCGGDWRVNVYQHFGEYEYQPNFTLYEVKYESMLIAVVENQVAALEDHLSVKSSEVRFENIAAENLKTAAEMFMYLNTCPGNDSLKNWFRSWSLFYDDLFKAHNIDHIILTMNRIIKSNLPPNKDAKVGSVLKRTAKLLSLKLGKIQSLLPGQSRNVTYTDDQSMNTSEGKKIAKVGVSGKN